MICLGLRPFLPIEPFCLCSIYRTDRIIVFIPILRAKKVCLIPYSHCDSPFFLLFFTYKDLFEALFISLAEGPDVGTGEREMSWMKYTYKEYYGSKDINADGATTGKTLNLFGISGRTESTGLGVFSCTQQLLNGPAIAITLKIKHGLKGKTFVVQGFGNVGFWASKYFTEEGSKLIGVSELDGSIYNSKDIDCLALKEHIHHHKGVKGFPGANYYEKEDVIYKHSISSYQPQRKCPSIETTLTFSNANWQQRQPMDQLPLRDKRFALLKVQNSCLMSYAMLEEWLLATLNGQKTWNT